MLLVSCDDKAPASPPPAAESASGIDGLAMADAALILPAVRGNPGVVYLTLKNSGDRTHAVRKFEVADAGRTEFHASMAMDGKMVMGEVGPQVVPAGGALTLKPNGLHIMVFDLADSLAAGGTTKLTVTIAGGRQAIFDLPVKAAGDTR